MEYRRVLGPTSLRVHPLCLGGNAFGWTVRGLQVNEVLDTYYDLGGNFIDTANTHARWVPGNRGGESEQALGAWMARRNHRGALISATKVGSVMSDDPADRGLRRRHIRAQAEETVRAFDNLVRTGKVRVVGASNHQASRLEQALDTSRRLRLACYQVVQPRYNLVDRDESEGPLEALCAREGLAACCYLGLASGFLTGKYRRGAALPASPRAADVQAAYLNARGFAALAVVDRVGARIGASAAQVALAWLLARPTVTAAIASASTATQVAEFIAAPTLSLSQDDLALLDRFE